MTEADVIKKAMVTAYEEGIFEILMPHLTVHDELDVSVPKTQNGVEALKRLKEIMETSIKLRVPILCSVKIGRSWSDADLKEITNMSDILGG
jgi:DNA polymerase I-like protein with 3'-5' exonuclease and polymerase domains